MRFSRPSAPPTRLLIPLCLVAFALTCLAGDLQAKQRTWTSSNGAYTVDAELIAFNDETIVLKKPDAKLIAVQLQDLSDEDREYVKSKEAEEVVRNADKMQTWTSVDGTKVKGRVIAYGKKTVNVQRRRGNVFIGERPFKDIEPLQQKIILKVISKLEGITVENERQLTNWAKQLGSEVKSYPLEGVLLQLESGDEVAVPFFMFTEEDLEILEPGWNLWLEKHESEESSEYESLMLQAQARAYHADQQAKQQIEMLKLDLLATATGVTSMWEVGLMPGRGVVGRPMSVVVTARDTRSASAQAMMRYPGYVVGPVRRLSR